MNGRFEEKLARIAFGDASPEEIAKIEHKAESDPEAAKALSEFRQLKAELRQMAGTPAHQLSNERLREAILAQGLHPKPLRDPQQGLGPGWLWMPVAAALLGIAFVNVRHRNATQPPQIFIGTPRFEAKMSPKIDVSPFNVEPVGRNLVAEADKKSDQVRRPSWTPARTVFGMSRLGTRHRRRPAQGDMLPNWDPNENPSGLQANNLFDRGAPSTPAQPIPLPVNAVAANPKPSANSPIVIIDSNPDAQTGALGATEVGTASNVVIGG